MDHSLFRPLGLHLFMMHSEFGWNKWFWYFILVYPRISTFFLFVKPVFFWCILSVFSLGGFRVSINMMDPPRLQAAHGCEVVLNDRCVIALGEGVRLQVGVSRILRWRKRKKPSRLKGLWCEKNTGILCIVLIYENMYQCVFKPCPFQNLYSMWVCLRK